MKKKYIVRLTKGQRRSLAGVLAKGSAKATELRRAQILLKADSAGPAWSDAHIADAFECHPRTVEGVRRRFCERGLDCVRHKAQATPPRKRVFDGRAEARLTTLACSEAPEGHGRWTLRLLADRVVQLEIVEAVSHETVRKVLKKTS
jgi:hypothetical protein